LIDRFGDIDGIDDYQLYSLFKCSVLSHCTCISCYSQGSAARFRLQENHLIYRYTLLTFDSLPCLT